MGHMIACSRQYRTLWAACRLCMWVMCPSLLPYPGINMQAS